MAIQTSGGVTVYSLRQRDMPFSYSYATHTLVYRNLVSSVTMDQYIQVSYCRAYCVMITPICPL